MASGVPMAAYKSRPQQCSMRGQTPRPTASRRGLSLHRASREGLLRCDRLAAVSLVCLEAAAPSRRRAAAGDAAAAGRR